MEAVQSHPPEVAPPSIVLPVSEDFQQSQNLQDQQLNSLRRLPALEYDSIERQRLSPVTVPRNSQVHSAYFPELQGTVENGRESMMQSSFTSAPHHSGNTRVYGPGVVPSVHLAAAHGGASPNIPLYAQTARVYSNRNVPRYIRGGGVICTLFCRWGGSFAWGG